MGYLEKLGGRLAGVRPAKIKPKNLGARLCVISSGAGYIVDVKEPSIWERVRAIPVCDVRAVQPRLLLFADFTKLIAYDDNGLRWESPRLSSDGIEITDIGPELVEVVGWDAAQQRKTRVVVRLLDGAVIAE